jgi:hypothetical protein
MTQPEPDVGLTFRRACCPVCHRRGRDVTVAFAVEGHSLFPLTRRPKQEELDTEDLDDITMLIWQHYGASYISESSFRPPIWPGSSTRVPEELERAHGPVVCRYGHRLRVPPKPEIDRMLKRIRSDGDVVFLPAARGCRM